MNPGKSLYLFGNLGKVPPNPNRTGSLGREGIPHEKRSDPQTEVTCHQGQPEVAARDRGDFLRTHSTDESGEPQGSRKGRPRHPLEGRGEQMDVSTW
jgi:hypothetical protein